MYIWFFVFTNFSIAICLIAIETFVIDFDIFVFDFDKTIKFIVVFVFVFDWFSIKIIWFEFFIVFIVFRIDRFIDFVFVVFEIFIISFSFVKVIRLFIFDDIELIVAIVESFFDITIFAKLETIQYCRFVFQIVIIYEISMIFT